MAASPAPSTASRPASASTRLFLALWPDDARRAVLAQCREVWRWPRGASPVASPQLHLTLHFLGNVEAASVPQLSQSLALPFSPFTLRFGMPSLWHASIAVLEPLAVPPALTDLQIRLGAVLLASGLTPEERPYRPHVTMARRAAGAEVPAIFECQFDWQVGSYALVESRAGVYSVLRSYPAGS